MKNPDIDKRAQAEAWTMKIHGICLFAYLEREINRGRSDVSIAKDFGVHRHTIRSWRTKTSVVVTKATIRRERVCK